MLTLQEEEIWIHRCRDPCARKKDHRAHSKKTAICKPRKEASGDANLASRLRLKQPRLWYFLTIALAS